MDGGINLFAYVHGNPNSLIDTFGLVDLNLFAPNDPLFHAADAAPSPPNTFTVGGHGNPTSMIDPQGLRLTPSQLANLIRSNPAYRPGMTIQLLSCNTGGDPGQGALSYAQQLANELCENIKGADNFVWYYPNGNTVVAPKSSGGTGPNLNSPGGYRTFTPQDQSKCCRRK